MPSGHSMITLPPEHKGVSISMRVRLDGVWMGDALGNKCEAFDPRWWRVDRWLRYYFSRRPKGLVTITVNGITREVRTLQVTAQPRKFRLSRPS